MIYLNCFVIWDVSLLFWINYTSVFYNVILRSQYEAEIHAEQHYKSQLKHMINVLSTYSSHYLTLSAPASMKLPRLCWELF